ncbi:large conductance mechanosensitive channel protein MscL [Rubrivirga sp.]|uniref:large conductance mechanosensitive channel protein MscL n=1 Tax=Rubrivirga sp. TaxID=1885344 RepID=UPI003B51D74F
MWNEFKDFAIKGNVVDLAVGLVIGAAFATIVAALVDGIVMPLVGLLIGGVDFSNIFTVLQEGATPGPYATLAAAQEAGAVVLQWGTLVNTIVTFLLVAFSIFVVVKWINTLKKEETPAEPELTADQALLTEIRDALVARPV